MKASCGRSPCAATFATMALAGITRAFFALFALFALLCTLFAAGYPVAAHAAPPAVADQTPEADRAIEQRDWASALATLDNRIASHPHDVQAKFKRATMLARLGRDDAAIAAFTELTQLYPELPEPYNNLAALYARQGRYDEARVALETSVKANPSYGLAYENLGDLYLHLAESAYLRATALGQTSEGTQERMRELQKLIAPGASNAVVTPAPAPAPASARKATGRRNRGSAGRAATVPPGSPFQPGGPLAAPPYVAPSSQ